MGSTLPTFSQIEKEHIRRYIYGQLELARADKIPRIDMVPIFAEYPALAPQTRVDTPTPEEIAEFLDNYALGDVASTEFEREVIEFPLKAVHFDYDKRHENIYWELPMPDYVVLNGGGTRALLDTKGRRQIEFESGTLTLRSLSARVENGYKFWSSVLQLPVFVLGYSVLDCDHVYTIGTKSKYIRLGTSEVGEAYGLLQKLTRTPPLKQVRIRVYQRV